MIEKEEKLINYINEASKCAENHGFHDREYSREYYKMLIIKEVSEAVDADRHGRYSEACIFNGIKEQNKFFELYTYFQDGTVQDELADVCIRIFDIYGTLFGFEVYSDFKKFKKCDYDKYITEHNFCENAMKIVNLIQKEDFMQVLDYIEQWMTHMGYDLYAYINNKMRYNKTRPMYNGKLY